MEIRQQEDSNVASCRRAQPSRAAYEWRIDQLLSGAKPSRMGEALPGQLVLVAPGMISGSLVRVILEPDAQIGDFQIHLMVNAFDANGRTPWQRWAAYRLVKYVDKKRFPAILAPSGLQLSRVEQVAQGTGGILSKRRFFAPFIYEGRHVQLKLTVKETADPNHANPLYTLEAVDFNEKSPAAQWVDASASAERALT